MQGKILIKKNKARGRLMANFITAIRKTVAIAVLFVFTFDSTGLGLESVSYKNDTLATSIISQEFSFAGRSKEYKVTAMAACHAAKYYFGGLEIGLIKKAIMDKYRNRPSILGNIDFSSLDVVDGIFSLKFNADGEIFKVEITDKSRYASLSAEDREWTLSESFAIRITRVMPDPGRAEPDMADEAAAPTNGMIREMIRNGHFVEIWYDGKQLNACQIVFNPQYIKGLSGEGIEGQYRSRKNIDISTVLTPRQAAKLLDWIKGHRLPPSPGKTDFIKFRVARDSAALNRSGTDIEKWNIAHAGRADRAIYVGQDLLRYMMSEGEDNTEIREIVLDGDEYRHLSESDFSHESVPDYDVKLRKVRETVKRLPLKGAEHVSYPETENDPSKGLSLTGKNDRGEPAQSKDNRGSTDIEMLKIDPEYIDIELALADDIPFIPNRFNNWQGIVRNKMVARVIVPRDRFIAKPIRGVARREVVLPTDDISDSYKEMRESIYVPSIKDHMENSGFNAESPEDDPGFVGFTGNGNLLMNPRIVAWKDGTLIKLEGEPVDKAKGFLEKPYPCFVRFRDDIGEERQKEFRNILADGKVQIRKLFFSVDGRIVRDFNTGMDVSGILMYANSGISIVESGEDSNIIKFINGELNPRVDNEIWQDYDIRHYLSLPFLGGDIGAYAMDQFYPGGSEPNTELIERALTNQPVKLTYESRYAERLFAVLENMGYKEVNKLDMEALSGSKESRDHVKMQYVRDINERTVTLVLQPALYPHNICVQTQDNKIVFAIAQGRSSSKGVAFVEIKKMLENKGIKVKNVIVFDNGGDAMLNYRGVDVAPSFNKRDRIMNMFVFRKKGVPRRALSLTMGTGDHLKIAEMRFKAMRSLHRYVSEKKSKEDKNIRFGLAERFIFENLQYLADQIETAYDVLSAFRNDCNRNSNRAGRFEHMMNNISFGIDKLPANFDENDINRLFSESLSLDNYLETLRDSGFSDITNEDIEALKEIWRLKTASIFAEHFCNFPGFDHRRGANTSGYDARISAHDDNIGELLGYVRNLRRVDMAIRYGALDREMRSIFNVESGSIESHCPEAEGPTSSEIKRETLIALKSNELRGSNLNRRIEFPGVLEAESLKSMMAAGKQSWEWRDRDEFKAQWVAKGYSGSNFTNGWCGITANDRLIFFTDRVVVFVENNGDLNIAIRGDDESKVLRNEDISKITIRFEKDGSLTVSSPAHSSDRALSRTTMAIQLTDSGIFDNFPALENVLARHLVWEKVSDESRERDILDEEPIKYDFIDRVIHDPSGNYSVQDILQLIDLKYCKSKILRQRALEAISGLYDSGHPFFITVDRGGKKEGSYMRDEETMRMIMIDFILQDVDEDFRVIERVLKNDKAFLPQAIKKIFGVSGIEHRDIVSVHVDYLRHEDLRQVYTIDVTLMPERAIELGMKHEETLSLGLSLTRHDKLEEHGADNIILSNANFRKSEFMAARDMEEASVLAKGILEAVGEARAILLNETDPTKISSGEDFVRAMDISSYVNTAKKFLEEERSSERYDMARELIMSPDRAVLGHRADEFFRVMGSRSPFQHGKIRKILPVLGAVSVEIDYRLKELTGHNKPMLENNIHVEAGESVEGQTLFDIIFDSRYREAEKREALRACVNTAIELYRQSKRYSGTGLYLKSFSETDFVLSRKDERSGWSAVIVNTNRLDRCPSIAELRLALLGISGSGYFSDEEVRTAVDNELLIERLSDYSPGINRVVANGNMVEISFDGEKLSAYKVVGGVLGDDGRELSAGEKCNVKDYVPTALSPALARWISDHRVGEQKKEFIKIRLIVNNVNTGWDSFKDFNDTISMGINDGCLYIGNLLLWKLLEMPSERKFILDDFIFEALSMGTVSDADFAARQRRVLKMDMELLPRKELSEKKSKTITKSAVDLETAVSRTADADAIVFDVDYTLNEARNIPIDDRIAEKLYLLIVNHRKKVRIISGRSLNDFRKGKLLEPLIRRLVRKNKDFDLCVYSSDGAERSVVDKEGNFVPDPGYIDPFTDFEADFIMDVLAEKHRELAKEQRFGELGIGMFTENQSFVKFGYSPYGKYDETQYSFETDPEEAKRYAPAFRKTRKELGEELVGRMNKRVKDVAYIVSGKSTIGFVRKKSNKAAAMQHILDNDCSESGKTAVYFGDEMTKNEKGQEGNDYSIAFEFTRQGKDHDNITVIALTDLKHPARELPDGVVRIGGLSLGTLAVISGAYEKLQEMNPEVREEKSLIRELFRLSRESDGKDPLLSEVVGGEGMHDKLYKIVNENGSYIFNYMSALLYPKGSLIDAARREVWVNQKLREAGYPVMEMFKKTKKQGWEIFDEDMYIYVHPSLVYSSDERDGAKSLHKDLTKDWSGLSVNERKEAPKVCILYRYMETVKTKEGDVVIGKGSFPTLTKQQNESMIEKIASIHKFLLTLPDKCPYPRNFYRSSILSIEDEKDKLKKLLEHVREKKPKEELTVGDQFVHDHAEFIIEQIDKHMERARPLYDRLRRVYIHGDYSPTNIIFERHEVKGVFDWEFSREEAMIYELAPLIRAGDPSGRFNIEGMKDLIRIYNAVNPLTDDEIRFLPEMFRNKLIDRITRLANPWRYFEGVDFDHNDTFEKPLRMMDKNDPLLRWHEGIISAMKDLDYIIESGTFEREIIAPLLEANAKTSKIRLISSRQRVFSGRARDVIRRIMSKNQQKSLVEEEIVYFTPLSKYSLSGLFSQGRPVAEVCAENPLRWRNDRPYYTNGWANLQASDKVIIDTEYVVVYQSDNNNLYIVIRGNDKERVARKLDRAKIGISANPDDTIMDIGRRPVGEYDLSRSTIAVKLREVETVPGVFKGSAVFREAYRELQKAIKEKLVWEEVDHNLRYTEDMDAAVIDLAPINRAVDFPDSIADSDIRKIKDFQNVKSKALRRKALEALSVLYDTGRIGLAEFESSAGFLLSRDIREDIRVIERGLKNDRHFTKEFINFLKDGKAVGLEEIEKLRIVYFGGDTEKELFRVIVKLRDDDRAYKAVLSLIRHDMFTTKTKQETIEKSIAIWKELSALKVRGIPDFGGSFWEYDYRAKNVKPDESEPNMLWENNIAVVARREIEGVTLETIITDKNKSEAEKRRAVKACRTFMAEFFNNTKEKTNGRGYSIKDPTPGQFVLSGKGTKNDPYFVTLVDLDKLVQFPDTDTVDLVFVQHMAAFSDSDVSKGVTLSTVLEDGSLSHSDKRRAIYAAIKESVKLFRDTKALLGEGYFIDPVDSGDFIVERRNNTWSVVVRGLEALRVFKNEKEVAAAVMESLAQKPIGRRSWIAATLEIMYYSDGRPDGESISVKDDVMPFVASDSKSTDVMRHCDILEELGIIERVSGNLRGRYNINSLIDGLVLSERDLFMENIINRIEQIVMSDTSENRLAALKKTIWERYELHRKNSAKIAYKYVALSMHGKKIVISLNDGNNNIDGEPLVLGPGHIAGYYEEILRGSRTDDEKSEAIMDYLGGVMSGVRTKEKLLQGLVMQGKIGGPLFNAIKGVTDTGTRLDFIERLEKEVGSTGIHPDDLKDLIEYVNLEGLIIGLIRSRNMDPAAVKVISAALAGPINDNSGILGTEFPTPAMPFYQYNFRDELEKRLRMSSMKPKIHMFNSAYARLLGEMDPRKGRIGYNPGGVVVLGDGINIAVGQMTPEGIKFEEDVKECGHYLIQKRYSDGSVHYMWVGGMHVDAHPIEVDLPHEEIKRKSGAKGAEYVSDPEAFRSKYKNSPIIEKGLKDFEGRMSTSGMLNRLAEQIKEVKAQGESHPELEEYLSIEAGLNKKENRDDFAEFLTRIASENEGNSAAVQWIKDIADETGKALGAFILAHRDRPFINRLILVSDTGEKMGRGLYENKEDEKLRLDIFMKYLRKSAFDEIMAHYREYHISEERAALIVKGIDRAKSGENKDLFAYLPSEEDITGHEEASFADKDAGGDSLEYKEALAVMETAHNINMSVIPPLAGERRLVHVISTDLLPVSAGRFRLVREIEKMQNAIGDLSERIVFCSPKNLERKIRELKKDGKTVVNVALASVKDLSNLPSGVRALVFEGEKGKENDFKQIEVVIAALRALHQGDIESLINIHNLLSEEAFDGDEKLLMEYLEDPRKLAEWLTIKLGPITIVNEDELKVLYERTLLFIRAA
jgi:thiamine kinase-like enzyme